MKTYLKNIVETNESKKSFVFAFFIQALIVLSIITFTIETTPGLSVHTYNLLHAIELFCIGIFSFEYAIRIYVADHKRKFIFSFFGMVDLFAILPFYLALGVDLRSLRALRFLRLFRLFKLARYNSAITHLTGALSLAKEKLLLFLLLVCILIYLSAVGIYYFEHNVQPDIFSSVFSSLWWAVVTLTTVGYGDIYPVTAGGRTFTFFILIVGIGTIAIPTGIISSALTEALDTKAKTKAK